MLLFNNRKHHAQCLKITAMSHSILRAKRATSTFFVDKKLSKIPKMVQFGEFLKNETFLRIFTHCVKAHHLCCCINISNLHLMGSWTVLLDPVPSELMAWHWYKPLSCRLTFCKTKLWLVIITPSSKLYFNGLPCNKTMKKSLKLSNI